KLLLRRARFLRSFMRIFRAEDDPGYTRIDRSYFDVSHFLRDADRFLGMTPRRFSKLSTPFLDGSVRARAAVLGHATQALHDIQDAPAKIG
ncbi:MAG TPA: AraC family transcriptional regulator, partial [Sphingomonas sp.]